MTDLIIKGSEWLRGEGAVASFLFRSIDGKSCCLGLHAIACGIPKEDLRDKTTPAKLDPVTLELFPEYKNAWTKDSMIYPGYVRRNNDLAASAFDINDLRPIPELGKGITDEERIEKLRPYFKAIGVNIIWRPDE